MMFEGIEVGTPIELLWGDAWSNESRYFYPDDPEGDFAPKKLLVIGYFCRETDDAVVIGWQRAVDKEDDNRIRSIFSIPKSWVIDWWEIKE